MAIKVAVHRVCDRCQHPFDESSLKYGEDLPKFQTKSLAAVLHEGPAGSGSDKLLFSFEDLCPDCDRVVDGYIRKIRMEEATDDAAAAASTAAKPKKSKKNEKTPEPAATAAPASPSEPEKPVAKVELLVEAPPTPTPTPPPADEAKELPSVAVNGAAPATEASPHPF